MPEGSYTTKLFTKGAAKIAQKVGEEAVETVIEAVANNNPDLVYEASDLIYHLLVLLENQGLSIADLEEELAEKAQIGTQNADILLPLGPYSNHSANNERHGR